MKKLYPLVALLAFCTCQSGSNTNSDSFLNQFKILNNSNLAIESIPYIPPDSSYTFTGRPILQSSIKNNSGINLFQSLTDQTYACYQVHLAKQIYAIILRSPSAEWSSSIKICIYNSNSKVVTTCLEVAEIYGDDGYELQKSALLKRIESGYELTVKTSECEADENFDNIKCSDSISTYHINASGIERSNKKSS